MCDHIKICFCKISFWCNFFAQIFFKGNILALANKKLPQGVSVNFLNILYYFYIVIYLFVSVFWKLIFPIVLLSLMHSLCKLFFITYY